MSFVYPAARRDDTVDDYHGTEVMDPYRWMEDPRADATREFVRSQNAVSIPYLDGLPETSGLERRIAELCNVTRAGEPQGRNGVMVWSESDGTSDQPIWMIESDATGRRVLLDPNDLSHDGTTAIVTTSLSPDGRLWAYSSAVAGSDWQVIRVRDTATLEDREDELRFVKFSSIAWWDDGFFYSRFPAQDPQSTDPSRNQRVMFHRLGCQQSEDIEWYANPQDPDLGYDPMVTSDGELLLVTEWVGTSMENGLLAKRLDGSAPQSGWIRIVDHSVGVHEVLDRDGEALLILTDVDAPNKRIIRLSIEDPTNATVAVRESDSTIERAELSAWGVVVVRLEDAAHVVEVHADDGEVERLDLPAAGSVPIVDASATETNVLVVFESFVQPAVVYRWNPDGLIRFAGGEPPIDPATVDVTRIHARSSDGSEVPMFLFTLSGRDGPGPVELYGYGGFSIPLTPMFSPARLAFLEAGGSVAIANLRGGIEFGEAWHRAGMLGSKQQVFDDFIACAESLIEQGWATERGVGASGRSNGGLLTAACMVQRPDLFGAVVSQVPVTDMLRYQHFTAGRYWTVEYGDASDREAFDWLYAYSPYHRVLRDGIDPPPLLVTTGESDDRVVPMHSLKLTAAVQHAVGGSSSKPLLLRVDTRAGHGLGKPLSKLIKESAHVYAFLLHHLTGG
jgi:prolyl oligopeptidase